MRINTTLSCAGRLRESSKGKEMTMAPMRIVKRRKTMRISGVRSESVIGCQRQKPQQTVSNFPDVKMATGTVKLADIFRKVGKQNRAEGQEHLQHPGETQQQNEGNGQNLGDEHQGLFLHLGNGLKDTDGDP